MPEYESIVAEVASTEEAQQKLSEFTDRGYEFINANSAFLPVINNHGWESHALVMHMWFRRPVNFSLSTLTNAQEIPLPETLLPQEIPNETIIVELITNDTGDQAAQPSLSAVKQTPRKKKATG